MNFQSYEDSIKKLQNAIPTCKRVEKIAITDALGRILAQDIVAKDDYPKYLTASMDGYACKFEDIDGIKNARLSLLGDVPAGSCIEIKINSKECIKTFTGSLMADGTDTLVPVENVLVEDGKVIITKPVSKGFAVRKVAESYAKGDVLIKKGEILNFSNLALLAELGYFHISVYAKLKISVLATGNEIKDLGEPLETKAQIHSSNHIAIASLAKTMGCETSILPIAKDNQDEIKEAILNGLSGADILITTGGVSMGDYDFVKSNLKQNFQIIIDGAAIKPGRHIKIAKFNDKYIFALPGFPYSAMVTCILYLSEFIKKYFSLDKKYIFNAVLDEDYNKKSPFMEFSACNVDVDKNGVLKVNFNGKKQGSSAIINNLDSKSALLIVPIDKQKLLKGEVVEIFKL